MKNIGFCYECRKTVPYVIKEEKSTENLKGKDYTYFEQTAICENCGTPLYVPELNDSNLKRLYDVYREENNIISLEKIREIPEKYNIGKRPLSRLLGWGEHTFSRYYEGDIPNEEYSKQLEEIYESPEKFNEILESGKSNLEYESAYVRSKERVNSIISNRQSKIDKAIVYLTLFCGDITPLSLQKALYYVQGFYAAFFEEYLFEEDCQAWVHGPVYPEIYQRFKDRGYRTIMAPEINNLNLTSDEVSVLDSVIEHFCCYSGKVLEEFTHNEMPWLKARGDLPANMNSDRIVLKSDIKKYFESVIHKYEMLKPCDIKEYSMDMFNKVNMRSL